MCPKPKSTTDTLLRGNCPCKENDGCMTTDCYQMEQEGVKEWQDELFAPKTLPKSLEEESNARTPYDDEFQDEMFQKTIVWHDGIEDGYPRVENLVTVENGKQIRVVDYLMQEGGKNPTFTNMSVDVSVPLNSWQIMIGENEPSRRNTGENKTLNEPAYYEDGYEDGWMDFKEF